MRIIKASLNHKKEVFNLLDDFYIACLAITSPGKKSTREPCSKLSNKLYSELISGDSSSVFLAESDGEYVGVLTVHKVPQLRKGIYTAEIEEMFVRDAHQGSGVAQGLLKAAQDWARENNMQAIRLESDNRLLRAHAFYEKQGFEDYGKAYMKKI